MTRPEEFESHRTYLAGLAYRLLGTIADAEDLVQETFLRWQSAGEPALDNPRAWFTRTCTRLCLDHLKSSRAQRENYVGEWLPEPLLPESGEGRRELDDTLSMALLTTIGKLQPAERAAFLLHDVFDYGFAEVAEILELKPANCRQLAARARRHLGNKQTRFPADSESVTRLSTAFFQAIDSGDLQGLKDLLVEDVVMRSDGGGKVAAAKHPIEGASAVVRFFDRIFISARTPAPIEPQITWFNGAPGVILLQEGKPVSAFQFQVAGGRIAAIFVQRNPDKLRSFRPEEGATESRFEV